MPFISFQSETISSVVKTADEFSIPPEATFAIVRASGDVIRYTLDGTTPTATTGMRLLTTKHKQKQLLVDDFRQIKVIRETGDAVLNVQFYTGCEIEPLEYWIWEDGSDHIWEDGSVALWD